MSIPCSKTQLRMLCMNMYRAATLTDWNVHNVLWTLGQMVVLLI